MRYGRRRQLLVAAGALAAAPLVVARTPARMRTLGFLSFTAPLTPENIAKSPFTARLKSLGWVEGENLRVERVYASGRLESYPALAAQLVSRNVDVIWAISPPAAVAAARATRTIPVVFARVVWPVELGLGTSFARPGGNVTGVASIADPTILAKPAEFLREIVPGVKRVLAIHPHSVMYKTVDGGEFSPQQDSRLLVILQGLGLDVKRVYVADARDVEDALSQALALRADALLVTSSPVIVAQMKRIVDFALLHRMPSAFIESQFVEAGGLLSYGSHVWETIFQSLDYVDAILRGAKAAELPIQLPTKMELAINLRTAGVLGLTVPQPLLLRADKIVD